MKTFLTTVLNILFFTAIIFLAIVVATIALTKKINEYQTQYNQGITATVMKQTIPISSFSSGIVKKIHIKIGQKVKKNDLLIEINNPVLQGKVDALASYPDNVSAQTEAKVAKEQLNNLNIYAPADGVINDVTAIAGSPIQELSPALTIYADDGVRLLSYLTVNQYQTVQQFHQVQAYSQRLNQNFTIIPDVLKPDEKIPDTKDLQNTTSNTKKIGLYFTFKNKADNSSLLNNEDLDLKLTSQDEKINKPIDLFVSFWNSLLLNNNHDIPRK